jgi:hypothetical protein
MKRDYVQDGILISWLVPSIPHGKVLMLDIGISSIAQVELYETPSGGFVGEIKEDFIDWI